MFFRRRFAVACTSLNYRHNSMLRVPSAIAPHRKRFKCTKLLEVIDTTSRSFSISFLIVLSRSPSRPVGTILPLILSIIYNMRLSSPCAVVLAVSASSAMAVITSTQTVTISSCPPETPITSTLTVTSTSCGLDAPCGVGYTVTNNIATPSHPYSLGNDQFGWYAGPTPIASDRGWAPTTRSSDFENPPDCTDGQTRATPTSAWHGHPIASMPEHTTWEMEIGLRPSPSSDVLLANPNLGSEGLSELSGPHATEILTKQTKSTAVTRYDTAFASSSPVENWSNGPWTMGGSGREDVTASWTTETSSPVTKTAVAAVFTGGASGQTFASSNLFSMVLTFMGAMLMIG